MAIDTAFAPFATASFDASPQGTAEGTRAERELTLRNDDLAAEVARLRDRLAGQMGENEYLRADGEGIRAEFARVRDANKILEERSVDQQRAIARRNRRIDDLKAEIARLDPVKTAQATAASIQPTVNLLTARVAARDASLSTLRAQLARAEEVEKAAGELVADSRHHHRHNNEHAVVVRRKFVSRLEQVMAATTSEPIFGDCDHERGLYGKYRVQRLDGSSGPGGKHEHCEYFVLDLSHDPHAIPAIHAYAKSCEKEYPVLAADLVRTYDLHFAPPAAEGPEQESGAGCRCETVRIPPGVTLVNAAWYVRLMLVVRRLGKRRRPNEMACYVTGIGEDIRDLSIVLADERDVVLRLSAPAAEGEVKP